MRFSRRTENDLTVPWHMVRHDKTEEHLNENYLFRIITVQYRNMTPYTIPFRDILGSTTLKWCSKRVRTKIKRRKMGRKDCNKRKIEKFNTRRNVRQDLIYNSFLLPSFLPLVYSDYWKTTSLYTFATSQELKSDLNDVRSFLEKNLSKWITSFCGKEGPVRRK